MNYIKQLQADKAEALDSARSIETEINHLISYLSCPKFHVDTRVQVSDVLQDILHMRNSVIYVAITLSNGGINDKNKWLFFLRIWATCRILKASKVIPKQT